MQINAKCKMQYYNVSMVKWVLQLLPKKGSWFFIAEPAARASHGNINEDDFDDCLRYREIGSFGEDCRNSTGLLNSKTPGSESNKLS